MIEYEIDLMPYFSDVLSGNGDEIDKFINRVLDTYADNVELIFEEGMIDLYAGVIGVRFTDVQDVVHFKITF